MTKFSSAWIFVDKYFATASEKYRDNWDRIFKKKKEEPPATDVDPLSTDAKLDYRHEEDDGA